MKKFGLRVISLILVLATLALSFASCAKELSTLSDASDASSEPLLDDASPSNDPPPEDDCALGNHSWKLLDSLQSVDCENDGILMYGCDCGEFYLQLQKTNGHSFGEWQTYTESTCDAMGEIVRTCDVCYFTESKPLAKCEHTYTVSDSGASQKYYECSVCHDSFTVDSELISNTFSSKSQYLFDCKEDFSFVILSSGDESEIRNHLRIIDQYYEGSDEEFSSLSIVEYTLEQLSDGVWKVSPLTAFVPGTTYKAIRSGDVVFQDFGVQNLSFSIEKEETNVVEFANGIVFLQALQNVSGGYYPYRTEYSDNSNLCYLTLQKAEGLHVGDVLCVGPATSSDDILENSSKNIFGKIDRITKIEQTGEFLVQLSKPSASELFDRLEIYSSKVSILENIEVDDSVLDQVSASLYDSEDFAKLLSATYTTAIEYLSAKGLSSKLSSFKEFLKTLEIEFAPFQYIESEEQFFTSISFEGEASIPVTLTADRLSETIGYVNLTFSSHLSVVFTPFVHFEDTKDFDFRITQELSAGLTFHAQSNIEYTATSKPYVLNTNSHVYHYKNCKHVAQIKDTSKIQLISTAELLQKVGDPNVQTIECGSCQPIQSMLSTMYVIHPTSGIFHIASCYSAKAIHDPLFTERSASALISDNYTPCGNCHPESVNHNDFQEQLLKKIASEDFGAHLDEVKEFGEALKDHTDGVAKPLLYASFSIYGIATLEVSLGIYLDVSLKASMDYEMEFEYVSFYGVRKTKADGLETYGGDITPSDNYFTKNQLTIAGKTRVDLGLVTKLSLSILGNRAFAVASADLDLKTGVYAKLHGAVQLDFVNFNENYAAGYFEAGLHCTVTISATVFEISLFKPKDLYKEDFPFVILGYAKVYYNFSNSLETLTLTQKQTNLAQTGLLTVKYYDLLELKSGTETLSCTQSSSHYRVELSLGNGEFCYIQNGKIIVNENVEDSFTDTLTVRVIGLDTWNEGDPNAVLVLMPEYTITINYHPAVEGTEGLAYTLLDDGTYEVSVGTATDVEAIVIPETYEDVPVTRIASSGFASCYKLKRITIANSVTSIGDEAFYCCENLTNVTIGNSLTSIESGAFAYCSSLTSITLPDSLTSIGNSAFYVCNSLTSIVIPSRVTSIGYDAFRHCSNLTSVIIGNRVTSIGNYAFYNCYSLRNVTLGTALTSIGADAFCYCNNLTSIVIPNSVTSIGDEAFSDCTSLSNVTMGTGVISIGNRSFAGCRSVTSIALPDSVTSIGENAFYYCTSLTSITLGNHIQTIGYGAFSYTAYSRNANNWENGALYLGNCLIQTDSNLPSTYTIKAGTKTLADYAFSYLYDLTSIVIPSSVTSIGDKAFHYCDNLTDIYFSGTREEWNAIENVENASISSSVTIHCSSSGEETDSSSATQGLAYTLLDDGTYEVSVGTATNAAEIVIPSMYQGIPVTQIAERGFEYCRNLTSIKIGKHVKTIGNYAFHYCPNLTSVTLSDGVTNIGNYAFYDCDCLTSITIPDNVTSIGHGAFFDCFRLTSVKIGNGVTSIGNDAFYDCYSLTSVTLGNHVTSIGSKTFYRCVNLTSITIPASVTSIDYDAFCNCNNLASITLPDSITSIDVRAFKNTAYFNDENNWENGILYIGNHLIDAKDTLSGAYTIKSGTKTIASCAFQLCYNLTSITIPNSVTSIGSSAFSWCNNLTSIVLPNSVTSIGDGAFSGCSSLKSITIPDGITEISYKMFSGCTDLTNVTLGDGITIIDGEAFTSCSSLTSITIPDSVTSIGDYAFSGCSNLTSITLGDGITSIGVYAFYLTGYYNDESNWPNGVLYIGNHLLETKDSILADYTIKAGTKTIADYAFSNRNSLTSITIPNSVTSIGDYAFTACSNLTSVTIGYGITKINRWAFYDCNNLTNVHITDLAAWCAIDFQHEYSTPLCWAKNLYLNGQLLTDVVIPNGITSIENYAFYDYDSLTSIVIPDSVTIIGDRAFSWCNNLTRITIPNSVTSIGNYAFYVCDSLTDIYFTGTEEEWNAIENIENAGISSSATIHFNYNPS